MLCVCLCVCVCVCTCMCARVSLQMCVCIHVCACMYECMCGLTCFNHKSCSTVTGEKSISCTTHTDSLFARLQTTAFL